MIKIGIECESMEGRSWGIGRILARTLKEISQMPELKQEFKFFLFFKSSIPDLPYLDNDIFEKRIIRLPKQGLYSFSLYYYLLLPLYLWFKKVDIMYYPNYMLPLLHRGKSIVHFTNDIYYEMRSPAQKLRHKMAYRIFGTWAVRHATHIMTISQASKNDIIKCFNFKNQNRIAVNYLGVDMEPRGQSRTPVGTGTGDLESMPINEELGKGKYLLYVGQAFPRRNVKETILAFRKIAPDFPGLKLCIIGADKYSPPILRKLASSVNRELGYKAVVHKDYVEDDKDLIALYLNALLVIYVSEREAFGLPPIEAFALGSIPVVARNDLTKELLGENAFFVDKLYDANALAETLKEALRDRKRRAEIQKASRQIAERFTWRKHTKRFLKLCEEAVIDKLTYDANA